MRTKKKGTANPVTQWVDRIRTDPAHRDEVEALLTEIGLRQDLIALREERGLTQVALAERVGVTQPTIAKLESDKTRNIELRTLVKVVAALGARVRIALEKSDARPKATEKPSPAAAPLPAGQKKPKRRAAA